LSIGVGTLAVQNVTASAGIFQTPPNFIVVFCDDLGYGDIGCFGSTKHRTPNIDFMAQEGVKFTSFYSASGLCTPSRASLMTGCYPRRIDMHVNGRKAGMKQVLFPVDPKGLNPDEITVADLLKTKGYSTACIGKWHLGDQPEFLPTKQGFDYYFGIPYSNDMGAGNKSFNYPPLPLLRNEKVIEVEPDQTLFTRRFTEETVKYIKANKTNPFFIYLAHPMPHDPPAASEEFRGKSANGIYGDAVEELDWSVGEILSALKREGLDERTLVIFTSDNGAASQWGGSNAPLSGWKGFTMEGSMRMPCVMRWPEKIKAGTVCNELSSTMDLLPTFAELSGAKTPADRIIDGRNISQLLFNPAKARSPHEVFYYCMLDQLQAVRYGKWKLHLPLEAKRKYYHREGTEKCEAKLFDLEADVAETKNVAAAHPDIVRRLLKFAEQARTDLGDGDKKGKNQRQARFVASPKPLKIDGP